MKLVRRFVLPGLVILAGVVVILVGAALLLSDQWLQSGDPIDEGRLPAELSFTAEDHRYVVRMGRRPGFGDGATISVNPDVARGAICNVRLANERAIRLQRTRSGSEGGITPDIGTFRAVPGTTRINCAWEPDEAWRGDLPVFVAKERTGVRRAGYGALGLGVFLVLGGGLAIAVGVMRTDRENKPPGYR